ncbi:MAG: Y-family DNA polymerase [Pedobacter sp.]|nr:Y-family DNA polymerase [Chitinophagaceae bacterium]
MKAIIDCNSFYCSCERVFMPHLDHRPVIVLSNNDGCIISRSDEAKAFGVEMAGPYFKAKPLIDKYQVATFSSNYNLYGNMSWRVMETLRMLIGVENVEVYSVDEAFLNLDHVPKHQLYETATNIKNTVEMWTGIKVSIGVAPTKVLSKVANRLSKKNKEATNGVLVLDTPRKIEQALLRTDIEEVWGVGYQYAQKLRQLQINTAWHLSIKSIDWASKHLGGVTGARLVRELQGTESIVMENELVNKKMIATTRMFGTPVTDIKSIKEAVATYTSRAAEKLRRQSSAARTISVFIVAKNQSHDASFNRGATISSYTNLAVATSLTHELIKPALEMAESLYQPGNSYKKAGVILSGIVPDSSIQGNLFLPDTKNKGRFLMDMMDNMNFAMRNDVLKFASSGTTRNWKMQCNHSSPRYTTRWDELYEIK